MAILRESRPLQNVRHFEAKQRNLARSSAVRARSEEPDKAAFPAQTSVGVEQFCTDAVHVHAAMDERSLTPLGDDQRVRFSQKCTDFRGRAGLICLANYARSGIGEYPKT